jgi:hypothetical protein
MFNPDKWSRFLNEEMLIEGRLQDAMKKYSDIPEFAIKQLSASDPSGKNAYLMWMVKELYHSGAGTYSVPGNAGRYIMDIVPLVTAFHNAKQRISQLNKARKKEGKGLYPNDLNQFKSLSQLENFIDDLGLSGSEEKRKEKEAALGGASILQDDEDFFIIRPETKESSCFFGKKTKWCISATRSQNYFDSYTNQGKAFYFILNKNLNDDSKYRKIALVYDKNGEFEEFFDVEDEGYSDSYELERILLYNLIAPAIKKNPDYPLKDEFLDMIAGALMDGQSLESFLGSNDGEEMNEEDKKLYEDIVKYLQGQGDLAYSMDEVPVIGDTILYDVDAAAYEFITLAQDTWGIINGEAYTSTMENPPGSFDSEELRQMVEDAGLEHIDVTYDDDYDGNWTWEGNLSVHLDGTPFDQLRYEVENVDGSKEITDDFEDAFGKYDDREMVRDLIQSSFDSSGMYIDELIDGDGSIFYLRMSPDYDEGPGEGLDGFREFLSRMKRYDAHYEEAIEKTYQDLVDEEIAIDPSNTLEDEEGGSRVNLKEILTNLKHMSYDIKSGQMNIYGKAIFNIPNMMRNFKELQKIFPALPDGQNSAISIPDEEKATFNRQKGYLTQFENALNDHLKSRPIRGDLLKDITDKLAAPIERTRDKRKQIEIPGLEDKPEMGTQQGRGAEEYGKIMKDIGVDFFRPNFNFDPYVKLLDNISQGQKDAGELSIGDRKIEGAHGIGMLGFGNIPLKDLRATRKSNPEAYYAYINGFKWLDDNWQEVQDFVGEWVSSQIVPFAKSAESDPTFADLTDAEFAQRARDQRPKSGLREKDELTESIIKEMEYAKKMNGKTTAADIVWGVKNVSRIANKYSLKTLQASIREALKRVEK